MLVVAQNTSAVAKLPWGDVYFYIKDSEIMMEHGEFRLFAFAVS